MKVLIAGDPIRGQQWEKYLRKRSSVTEVIVMSEFQKVQVDAVVLLDDSPEKLTHLLNIIRLGYPVYLVSPLPTDTTLLQKVHHSAEESNVSVQFSHWGSFSTMTRWVRTHLHKTPGFIEIRKHERGRTVPESAKYRQAWVDELAFILSLQSSSVQQLTAQPIHLNNYTVGIHITLRFENGAFATVHYMGISASDSYEQLIQTGNSIFLCDILQQKATHYTSSGENKLLKAEHRTFDASKAAENSIDYFIRSIKTHKPSGFTSSSALQTARLANKIDALVKRV